MAPPPRMREIKIVYLKHHDPYYTFYVLLNYLNLKIYVKITLYFKVLEEIVVFQMYYCTSWNSGKLLREL